MSTGLLVRRGRTGSFWQWCCLLSKPLFRSRLNADLVPRTNEHLSSFKAIDTVFPIFGDQLCSGVLSTQQLIGSKSLKSGADAGHCMLHQLLQQLLVCLLGDVTKPLTALTWGSWVGSGAAWPMYLNMHALPVSMSTDGSISSTCSASFFRLRPGKPNMKYILCAT